MGVSDSMNTIDRLLSHTEGPSTPVTERDLTRARSSAYIVHGNFRELATMCDDITTTGVVVADAQSDKTDVENEVYRRVHNYLSAFYSYNEQIQTILRKRLEENIHKGYFLPERDDKSAPSTFDGGRSSGVSETIFNTATIGVSLSYANGRVSRRDTIISGSRNGISKRLRKGT